MSTESWEFQVYAGTTSITILPLAPTGGALVVRGANFRKWKHRVDEHSDLPLVDELGDARHPFSLSRGLNLTVSMTPLLIEVAQRQRWVPVGGGLTMSATRPSIATWAKNRATECGIVRSVIMGLAVRDSARPLSPAPAGPVPLTTTIDCPARSVCRLLNITATDWLGELGGI